MKGDDILDINRKMGRGELLERSSQANRSVADQGESTPQKQCRC